MNISSVVVRANPRKLEAVRTQLAALPGVEICADCNDGRVVVTIEDTPRSSTADAYASLHAIDGVINAALVYQYCDDAFPEEPEQ
jgi:periplasmic nitrate reductase NapD